MESYRRSKKMKPLPNFQFLDKSDQLFFYDVAEEIIRAEPKIAIEVYERFMPDKNFYKPLGKSQTYKAMKAQIKAREKAIKRNPGMIYVGVAVEQIMRVMIKSDVGEARCLGPCYSTTKPMDQELHAKIRNMYFGDNEEMKIKKERLKKIVREELNKTLKERFDVDAFKDAVKAGEEERESKRAALTAALRKDGIKDCRDEKCTDEEFETFMDYRHNVGMNEGDEIKNKKERLKKIVREEMDNTILDKMGFYNIISVEPLQLGGDPDAKDITAFSRSHKPYKVTLPGGIKYIFGKYFADRDNNMPEKAFLEALGRAPEIPKPFQLAVNKLVLKALSKQGMGHDAEKTQAPNKPAHAGAYIDRPDGQRVYAKGVNEMKITKQRLKEIVAEELTKAEKAKKKKLEKELDDLKHK